MRKNSHLVIGTIILLFGLFFLARNLGWIPYDFLHFSFQRYWPVILIVIGVWFLVGKQRN